MFFCNKRKQFLVEMEEIYDTYLYLKKQSNIKENIKDKWQFYCPLILKLENLIEEKVNIEDQINLFMMLGYANYEKSRLLIECDDLSSIENLEKSLDLLRQYRNHNKIIYIYLKTTNLYSFLQSKNNNLEKAKEELLEAKKLYHSLENKTNVEIYSTDDVFKPNNVNKRSIIKLEKLVTNNLQMLSWIYNKQNLQESFVVYHHEALRRQLEYKDGSALIWVQKCSRLSSYFLSKQRFHEARHHLASALTILYDYEKELKTNQQFVDNVDLQQYYADVARYWVKYGLFLFNASHTKVNDIVNVGLDLSKGDTNEDNFKSKISDQNQLDKDFLLFPTLNLKDIEEQVTCEYILTTNQARLLFTYCQNWLKKSKDFYTIQEHTLDYVNLILDLSELYRYLAYYEQDFDSRYNVQKRRMDALETLTVILKEARPSCYIAVSIDLFRELTEVQMELLSINIDKLGEINMSSEIQVSLVKEYNNKKSEAIKDISNKMEDLQNKLKLQK